MKPVPGLDLLRCLALLLITWQHAASVLGYYETTEWRGISPGQLGVGIFCAISGYLACLRRPDSLQVWVARRLWRLFPAYWIVTLAAFAMAWVVSAKNLTPGLFVSQMFGMGFFTHGWELVNVVSWFVSLILLCYLLVLLAFLSERPFIFWIVVAVLAALVVSARLEVSLSRHVIAFALGALLAIGAGRRTLAIIGVALTAFGVMRDPAFAYGGVALLAVLSAALRLLPGARLATLVTRYSYEYFLVHGIFLAASVRLIAQNEVAVAIAVPLAAIAAVGLERIVVRCEAMFLSLSVGSGLP